MRQVQDQASKLRHTATAAAKRLRTIAITSGKGGVGKTSLAVNLSLLMAGDGHRVALFDGDMGLANVDVLLGLAPKFTLRHVVEGQKDLAEIMLQGPNGLHVIPGSRGVEAMAHLSSAEQTQLLERLGRLEGMLDILLIDTAAGISPNVLSLVLAADEAIVVTVPEPTSITDAYAVIKVLSHHRADPRASILMNMVESASQAEEVFKELQRVIRHFLKVEVGYAGHVLRDECVGRAVCEQKPFSIYFPYARASRSVQELARSLAEPSRHAPQTDAFWGRMVHWSSQL